MLTTLQIIAVFLEEFSHYAEQEVCSVTFTCSNVWLLS
jgi:hypothetical protein